MTTIIKKMTRYVVIFIFTISIIISELLVSVNAISKDEDFIDNVKSYFYVENEFESINDRINEYRNKINLSANKRNISEDIKIYNELIIVKSNIKKHIYNMKNYSQDELKAFNYTDEQIKAIKAYDGSDELSVLASATVSGTLTPNSFKYTSSDNKTRIKVTYTTKWNGVPYFKYYDVVGIGIGGSEAGFFYSSSTFECKKQTNQSGTNPTKSVHNGAGISYKFNIADKNNTAVFTSTVVTYSAIAGGKVSVAGIEARYAHWQIAGSTSFSISASGPSVSFSMGGAYNLEHKTTKTLSNYI